MHRGGRFDALNFVPEVEAVQCHPRFNRKRAINAIETTGWSPSAVVNIVAGKTHTSVIAVASGVARGKLFRSPNPALNRWIGRRNRLALSSTGEGYVGRNVGPLGGSF